MKTSELRQQITNQIIDTLEQGTLPWRCPWDRTQMLNIPCNVYRNDDYHGINVMWLWCCQLQQGYGTGHWLTYRQAQQLGGQVRKDEHGFPAIFYKAFEKETAKVDDHGDPVTEQVRVLRHYTVFNLDQIDGVSAPDRRPHFGFESIEAAERILRASGITILHGGARACYKPYTDTITMPDRNRFASAADYYATALHELTHATKAASRCSRPKYETSVHKGAYAFEELVAELGSVYCMSALGLHGEIADHAGYIDDWLSVLKEDTSAIFRAAAQAETAYQWLIGQVDTPSTETAA